MLSLALPGRVFLCTLPTDMRKGFDSLAALVQTDLGQDPLSGDLFVFRSKRGDRLKLLYWDQDGLAVWYKKQVQECPHCLAFTEFGELAHNLPVRLT
jgi:transposase